MSLSRSGGYLASVGLDRYARVYSSITNKAVAHVYVKNRTNFVQFLDDSEGESQGRMTNRASASKKRKARELDEEGEEEDELVQISSDLDDDEEDSS